MAALAWVPLAACAHGGAGGGGVAFDTAGVWVVAGSDSARLTVEVARTLPQQELGLMDRSSLDADRGMLFVFDSARTAGFWMWRTRIPLDVAFLDQQGSVLRILTLEPCLGAYADDCPEHSPGVAYRGALEVNAGWFRRHGLGEGATVRAEPPVTRAPPP